MAVKPQYVSVNTGSVTFALPYMTSPDVVPLSTSSSNCSNSTGNWVCTADFVADVGNDQALTVKTFASDNGTGAALSENTVDINVCSCPASENAVTVTLNGIAYKLVLTLTPNSVSSGTPSTVNATWTALDNSGATIVGSGTIVDEDGNAVVPQLADSDTTGDTSIGTYNGTTDSWPITYNDGTISSPTFTLSAPSNVGLTAVTQMLTVTSTLETFTNTDSSLTLGKSGSVDCVPSNCDTVFPSLSTDTAAGKPLWMLQPDGWNVNSSASGSASVEYTGSGSIVAKVDFSGLTNDYTNGGPLIIYGRQPCCAGNADDQGITFPVQLSSLNALNIDVAYSLDNTAAPYDQDVMFDEYLMPSSTYVGSNSGAVECAPKIYTNFGQNGSWYVGTITVPFTINGVTSNVTYDEWYNGEPVGSSPKVFFTIGNPNDSPAGTFSGEVSFNILPFLNACASIVPNTGSSWWVSGMLLSNEYGSGTSGSTSINYTWTITKILYQEVSSTP